MQLTDDLGPQNPRDGVLLRRVRLHQSWYRSVILGLPRWGTTRGSGAVPLGSVLSDRDGAEGLNFGSAAAFELYRKRRAAGWGIDPRSSTYMTSSQALAINIFGLLDQDEAWFLRCLNRWLDRADLHGVTVFELEFAPAYRSLHLNDQTRIDALVVAQGENGPEVIAIEVKYADRFNSRYVDIETRPYQDLACRSGLWSRPPQVLGNRQLNQLARIHALATSYAMSVNIAMPASLLVLSHEMDSVAQQVVTDYRSQVNGPFVHNTSLRKACTAILTTAPARFAWEAWELDLRYGA